MLDEWLHRITEELTPASAQFAVNLIVHKSNTRLEEDLALCVKWKVPVIITSLGAREDVNQAVHGYGGITLHDIINSRFAHKAIEKGADGLIAVAAGAGGHAGTLSPFALNLARCSIKTDDLTECQSYGSCPVLHRIN